MEARAYNQMHQRRRKVQKQAYRHNHKRGTKMRARTKIQKKSRVQMKQVTMAHRMQMSRLHPKRPDAPRRCGTFVFTRIA